VVVAADRAGQQLGKQKRLLQLLVPCRGGPICGPVGDRRRHGGGGVVVATLVGGGNLRFVGGDQQLVGVVGQGPRVTVLVAV
jgi:hypothetical protein